MERRIIHIDLDAFFCAVEENKDSTLVGIPFAVGGKPNERGVVSSCSYAARFYGVHSGMPMARAIRLCPPLKIVPPKHSDYRAISKDVMDLLTKWSNSIEQISIDEAFLDISQNEIESHVIGKDIMMTIKNELQLPCSIGIASNKLVAKTANDFGKTSSKNKDYPKALTIVPLGQEAQFLRDLPVEALWGVGPKTAEKLAELDIFTIGQLAEMPVHQLEILFGKIGNQLHTRSKGIDDREIVTLHEPKSFSNEVTFSKDISNYKTLLSAIERLSERTCTRLIVGKYTCYTIKIKIRWSDFSTISRQKTLLSPTNSNQVIFEQAKYLFDKYWTKDKAVRLIGIGLSNLVNQTYQLNLFNNNETITKKSKPELLSAVKTLQEQFGKDIIHFGNEDGLNEEE